MGQPGVLKTRHLIDVYKRQVEEDVLKIIAGKLIDYQETFPYILYLLLLIGQFAFLYFYLVFFG